MGCRGIIARAVSDGFRGRYNHNSSKPECLGKELWNLYHGHFKGDLNRMLIFLIDEHTGWSNIVGADFKRKPRWIGNMGADYMDDKQPQPVCYCHGDTSHGTDRIYTDADSTDCEWCYVFTETQHLMTILTHTGFEGGDWENGRDLWRVVGVVQLDGPEPDWCSFDRDDELEEAV